MFSLGIFTTLASVIRIAYLHKVVETGDNSSVVMLGTLEFNIGVSEAIHSFVEIQADNSG